MKEALFWSAIPGGSVQCGLCHHRCRIEPGRRGLCNVRENRDGVLVSLFYGRPVAVAVDPIEKKPLYHFLPGSQSLSVAARGCNFRCLHCQNAAISQAEPDASPEDEPTLPAEAVVRIAERRGCASLSYTYTEPTVFFEYAFDIAQLAAGRGLKNVFVTNGYITPEALGRIRPYLDAANIDLKFIEDEQYRRICGARLAPVLDMIRLYHELGIWIEVTTLLIPARNDSDDHLRRMAAFLAALDPTIPWHVSAFHPMYKMLAPARTPAATLTRARELGLQAGLKYVYTGNVLDAEGSATRCPGCAATIIERRGFSVTRQRLGPAGQCPDCGAAVEGVWAVAAGPIPLP